MNKKEIIKKAYIFGYPIVGMYKLLYDQVLNPSSRTTGFHAFFHASAIATPQTSFVPAPNNDTTYSRMWLDLRGEPIVIQTPDMHDRYYGIQLLDLFSETITNIGKRLNGTKAQTFAVVGPNWTGKIPEGVQVVSCNTTFAIAFLRILIKPEDSIEAIQALQNGFRVLPLSAYENRAARADDAADGLPPCDTADAMCFFETLNKVLALTPMFPADAEILADMETAGIGPGLSMKLLSEIPAAELKAACDEAVHEIDQGGMQFGQEVNFWRIAREGIGNYATDYFQRAVVWHKGALANQPAESLYPSTFQDSMGERLEGTHRYMLHFSKKDIPPVSQFWSLTMYRFHNALLVENKIDRYSIGDRTKGLHYDQDGGLTIYLQSERPEKAEKRANWLPAPKEKFFVTLRLYGPGEAAISGLWKPPAIQKCE